MTRRILRVAHRWLGLLLLLPLLVQGGTGTVLALTPVWEALRPMPAAGSGPSRPGSEIVAAAVMPGLVAVRYRPPVAGEPATVDLAPPGKRAAALQVSVDPASLAVLATRQASAAYRWVHALHEDLLLPELAGRSVVGWFGVGLLLLGLSGLVLWWPSPGRWRLAISVDTGAKGVRLQRELHGAAGFWACAMLVVMSLSGISLAFPQTVRSLLSVPGGGLPRGAGDGPVDVDAVLALASRTVPGATVTDMRLPNPPGRPVMLRLQRADDLTGAPPVVAMIDSAGRRVLSVQDPRTQTAALALGWLRALHFGDAFGLPWRALVVLTGMALPLLALTGVAMWLLRRRNRHRLTEQRRAAVLGLVP